MSDGKKAIDGLQHVCERERTRVYSCILASIIIVGRDPAYSSRQLDTSDKVVRLTADHQYCTYDYNLIDEPDQYTSSIES